MSEAGPEVVKLLVDAGAEMHALDAFLRNPPHLALDHCAGVAVMRLLLTSVSFWEGVGRFEEQERQRAINDPDSLKEEEMEQIEARQRPDGTIYITHEVALEHFRKRRAPKPGTKAAAEENEKGGEKTIRQKSLELLRLLVSEDDGEEATKEEKPHEKKFERKRRPRPRQMSSEDVL